MSNYPTPPRSSSTISKPDLSARRHDDNARAPHHGSAAASSLQPDPFHDRNAHEPVDHQSARESLWHQPDLTVLSPKPWDLTFKPALGRASEPYSHAATRHAHGPTSSTSPSYVNRSYSDGERDHVAPWPTPRRPGSCPPKPLHYSPRHPPPSAYSAARPQPRPGFLRRLRSRINRLSHAILRWIRRHPVAATMLSIVPVLVAATAFKGLKKLVAVMRSLGSRRHKGGDKKSQKWGYGFDDFANFAGSEGGPLEGLLMILRMAIDHYCRLTHSAIPRAASILLHLYFIQPSKKSH
ncbi:hypothetical protein K3495_g5958 [Podosphaera aphanis]|nr:hypothetical protein K3495_g5958 [Podosphaera aphanis]